MCFLTNKMKVKDKLNTTFILLHQWQNTLVILAFVLKDVIDATSGLEGAVIERNYFYKGGIIVNHVLS